MGIRNLTNLGGLPNALNVAGAAAAEFSPTGQSSKSTAKNISRIPSTQGEASSSPTTDLGRSSAGGSTTGSQPATEGRLTSLISTKTAGPGLAKSTQSLQNIRKPQTQQIIEKMKTTTQLAQAAIAHLNAANPALIKEAIQTMKSKDVKANTAITYIGRKTMISEVLPQLAKNWSTVTKQDFGNAFQMDTNKSDVMDIIVHISILNDEDLEEELRSENTEEPEAQNLLENRRIIWQYPEPGTQLDPPYVVMVAVDYQDDSAGEDIVQSILSQLVDYQGYKIPKIARQKLG